MGFQKVWQDIVQIVFPNICQLCNAPLPAQRHYICDPCYNSLEAFQAEYYPILIARMEDIKFDKIIIAFQFTEIFKKIIHLLKYGGYQDIATLFAHSLLPLVQTKYDIITSVPLHPQKERERGFNQSTLIAKHLAMNLEIPFDECLTRIRYTKSQTKLNREQRKQNMKKAFSLSRSVEGKKLLIVDDVVTTGATLNSCAGVLKEGKCKRVDIMALSTPVDILQEKLEQAIII